MKIMNHKINLLSLKLKYSWKHKNEENKSTGDDREEKESPRSHMI